MPTVDIKGKLDSMKGIKMPSAADMAESLNPMNSLKRPLGVRVREEDPAVQRERALIVKNSTPSELGNLRHPLDIPMPKLRSRNKSAEASAKKAPKVEENGKEMYVYLLEMLINFYTISFFVSIHKIDKD